MKTATAAMILILSEPTEKDIELVKQILGDKTITAFEIPSESKQPIGDWLSQSQFKSELQKKGYKRCSQTRTCKDLCDRLGIAYEKRGREIWFRNELHKIPERS